MTTIDETQASPLALTRDEYDNGVVAATVITHKRLTVVILESEEGFLAVGSNAPWPTAPHAPHLGLAAARHHATERLAILRERADNRQARRVHA